MAKAKTKKPTSADLQAEAAKPATENNANIESQAQIERDFSGEWNIDQWERASVEIWRPQPGECVIGTYDSSDIFEGDFDEPCKVHRIIDRDTGNKVSFVGGTMCDKFMEDADISKGDRIYVKYLGQGETNKGNRVNNFDIRYMKQ